MVMHNHSFRTAGLYLQGPQNSGVNHLNKAALRNAEKKITRRDPNRETLHEGVFYRMLTPQELSQLNRRIALERYQRERKAQGKPEPSTYQREMRRAINERYRRKAANSETAPRSQQAA